MKQYFWLSIGFTIKHFKQIKNENYQKLIDFGIRFDFYFKGVDGKNKLNTHEKKRNKKIIKKKKKQQELNNM